MDNSSSSVSSGDHSDNIPKGPTIIALWCKDDDLSAEEQAELLEEAASLITATWTSNQTELIEIVPGNFIKYLNLDRLIANWTIYKSLSKLR